MLNKLLPNQGFKAYFLVNAIVFSPVAIILIGKALGLLDNSEYLMPYAFHWQSLSLPALFIAAFVLVPLYKHYKGEIISYSRVFMIRIIILVAIIDGLFIKAFLLR